MSAQSPNAPTVIVIDDSRANLLAKEGVLGSLGYSLVLADKAEDGLNHALSDDVALVIADVRMPRVDGLEMLARLRERVTGRKVPVLFVSGYAYDSEQARRAYSLGAVDYILKPIDPDILRAKVGALVTLFVQEQEIKRHRDALIESERTAQRALAEVRDKDRHIGVLGHDLRNPLAAMTAGVDLLRRSPNLSDAERARLARMSETGRRMAVMIHDLLDYTRSSAGAFPHNPVPTDLQRVCEAALDELRAVHQDRRITCEVVGDVAGRWDPGRLQQVISNLVGNALQHSTGAVSVRIEGAGRDVVLSVHNDGEPISPEMLPVLFEPFRRGDRSPNGLGLGLYIVREVIRRHGGTINVVSSSDKGTTFVSRWPREPAVRSTSQGGAQADSAPEPI
jgi:signal transduction histidine kinase